MANEYLMTRALNRAKLIVGIDEVSNGLSCDCSCLDCGAKLIARQGDVNTHSFSHRPGEAEDRKCKWSYETDLHIIAKEVIRLTKELSIPLGNNNPNSMELQFEEVELEKSLVDGKLRPDIRASFQGEIIHIEIAVTNTCKQDKVIALRKQNLNVVEIDLSDFEPSSDVVLFDEVKEYLKRADKKWLSVCPSGYVGTLINEHERTLLRDLVKKRKSIQNEVSTASDELCRLENALNNKRVTFSENQRYLEKISLRNEAHKNKLKQEIEPLKKEVDDLQNEKLLTSQHIQFQIREAVKESKELAQEAFNDEKEILRTQYFTELEKADTLVQRSIFEAEKLLEQLNIDVKIARNEHLSLLNKTKKIQEQEQNLVYRERHLKRGWDDIQVRVRKYQIVANNLKRISPDLRAITRNGGMGFPFDKGVIEELEKPIVELNKE